MPQSILYFIIVWPQTLDGSQWLRQHPGHQGAQVYQSPSVRTLWWHPHFLPGRKFKRSGHSLAQSITCSKHFKMVSGRWWACLRKCIDSWVTRWVDAWISGLDEWLGRDEWVSRGMGDWVYGWMGEWLDGWMGRMTDGKTLYWVGRCMDKW